MMKLCRVVENTSMNEEITRIVAEGKERIAIQQAQGLQKPAVKNPGMLDSLCLESDDS